MSKMRWIHYTRGLFCALALLLAWPALGQEHGAGRPRRHGTRKAAVEKYTLRQLEEGARKEGSVLWYAGTSPMHRLLVQAFQERCPFLKVEALYLGGPALNQRFLAEKERGIEQADVFSTGLTETYPDLRSRGFLAKLEGLPHWPRLPRWARDEHGAYAFFQATRHGILYNTKLVTAADVPDSFEALAAPRWKDQVALVDPQTGGMGAYFARFAASRPELGFSWLGRMRSNGAQLVYQSGQLTEAVAGGRRLLGVGREVEAVEAQRQGAPLGFKLAKEGFPYQFSTASVNSRAPHPYAARLLADWLISTEARAVLEKNGYEGIHEDLRAIRAQGGWILDIESITPRRTQEFLRQAGRALKGL